MASDKYKSLIGKYDRNTYNYCEYISMLQKIGVSDTNYLMGIRSDYDEFIKKYNILNSMFDLKNPVEIFTLFNFLLSKGYLSRNKKFNFTGDNTVEYDRIMGTSILTGRGVCRHITPMLCDILNDKGITSYDLRGYLYEYNINFSSGNGHNYSEEELRAIFKRFPLMTEGEDYEKNLELLLKLKNEIEVHFSENIDNPDYKIDKEFGNHVITMASKNGKIYFLDPTNNVVFNRSGNNRDVLIETNSPIGRFDIKIQFDNILGTDMEKENFLSDKKLSCENEEYIKRLGKKTLDVCHDNMDIFEKFYSENSDMYEDISERVLVLKNNIRNKGLY